MTGKGRDTFGESQGPSCSKASYQFGKKRFEPLEGDQTVADKLCKRLVTKEVKGQRTVHQFKSIVSSKAKGELKKGIYRRTLHKAGGIVVLRSRQTAIRPSMSGCFVQQEIAYGGSSVEQDRNLRFGAVTLCVCFSAPFPLLHTFQIVSSVVHVITVVRVITVVHVLV